MQVQTNYPMRNFHVLMDEEEVCGLLDQIDEIIAQGQLVTPRMPFRVNSPICTLRDLLNNWKPCRANR